MTSFNIKSKTGEIIYDSAWTEGVEYTADDKKDDSDYSYESDSDDEDKLPALVPCCVKLRHQMHLHYWHIFLLHGVRGYFA